MTPSEQKPNTQPAPVPQSQQDKPANTPTAPATPPPAEQTEPKPAPSSTPSKPVSHSAPMNSSLVLTIAVAAVVFVLVSVGAVLAYQHPKTKQAAAKTPTNTSASTYMHSNALVPESSGPSNCPPVKATSLTQSSAETAYRNFVKAVVAQNQTCADDQSSSFFLTQSKTEFGAADGKWITASPQGIRPIWKDLSQLPSTLSDASFTQSDYTRPVVMQQTTSGLQTQSSSSSSQPQGIKLSYPVDISQYTGSKTEKWQVSISFVLQNSTIQVDDLVVEPQK